MKALTQSLSVAGSILFVFLVQLSEVSTYSSYLLAFLIIFSIIYITVQKRSKSASQLFTGSAIEFFSITAIIVFIVAITQGLNSPLFFFLYFLPFLLAFMGESAVIWVFLGGILLYFLPEASRTMDTNTFIKLGSILLITPLAYFVAKELERRQLLNRQIESTAEDIKQRAQVLKESTPPNKAEENEAIDEIIEEADALEEDARR